MMKIVERDGKIKLSPEDVEYYRESYTRIVNAREYIRTDRDYFVLDMDNNYNDVDRMSKWSVMSTIIHKIDKSIDSFPRTW